MKLLTATAATQGARDNDYNWTVEGELVLIQPPCARDRRDPDGGCGCGRGFAGLNSHRATTTALVRDLPMTRADVGKALAGYLESDGWGWVTPDELVEPVEDMLAAAATLAVGDVVERRLDVLRVRAHNAQLS